MLLETMQINSFQFDMIDFFIKKILDNIYEKCD